MMKMRKKELADIFNEWSRRYADHPDEFVAVLDADGRPVNDYGEKCAIYFAQIAADIEAATTDL